MAMEVAEAVAAVAIPVAMAAAVAVSTAIRNGKRLRPWPLRFSGPNPLQPRASLPARQDFLTFYPVP
jgi:hypothetical protein